ncbi:response regulator transcription factor [Paenibacillus sp. P96]|uniref:Response regulator transcription factor n=1 Tax=Paenibacillus zeirhizosphaerae TaxID=2987519 RepID=A0ABT9FRT7_9BACL|nr:response regulator transcription factor [Paenibacillus sp. P96]MDP4097325.1 response regulator transcription factor [Paenibacillus sp. P96]
MYKVFIVDDEPFIIEGLYDIVDWAAFGLEIVGHAGHGQLALERLSSQPVDILITDISMPVLDGLQLIREMRQRQHELKVIILSGFNDFDYLKEGMQLGIDNYLLKPINIEELEATLRNIVTNLDKRTPNDAYGMQILKDNTLHRLLTGQIACREFEERAEFMGITLDGPYIGVASIHADSKQTTLFEGVEQRALEAAYPVLFHDVDGDTVIIANLPNRDESAQAFKDWLTVMAAELAPAYPSLLIGIGGITQGLEGAPTSYREAKKAMEYVMVYPELQIIDYERLGAGHFGAPAFTVSWSDYAKLMMARNQAGIASRIRTDFERHSDGITPAELQHAALELVIRFKMELEQIKHTDESAIFQTGLQRVMSSTTLEELVLAVQEVGAATVQSLLQDMKNPTVSQVLNHIHTHYADELSLKLLGAQYHLHPVYLGQLFQKETGETFAEYINKYRIERAKEQLKNTSLKVHEIARNVGYWETGYFYKQFRKYVGISPTDFKTLG